MIRERVSNQGAISRHRLITEYGTFVLINKYDANDVFLYKQDFVNHNHAYYIRYSNDNQVSISLFNPTEMFSIFDEDYNAFIADNVTINCDIAYDKKPYTTTDNFYNG